MKLKFNSQTAFDTAFNSLRGNNFKFDTYRDELALKFFTSECVVNAKLEIIAHGLVDGPDFVYDRYAA
jgi:hypothetical protein